MKGGSWGIAAANASADPQFAVDVIAGLSRPAKTLPCRWFYDARGSELFERITELPEYYLTRAETEILSRHAGDIASLVPANAVLVEFGSGSSRKTELLLAALTGLAAYAPIDVSESALHEAERRLARLFPNLRIAPIVGDFSAELRLPPEFASVPRIGFFPGSTIGNFARSEAANLLRRLRATLDAGARLVVGVDLRKPLEQLLPAYNDAGGVTAAFNLNLLARINSELGGDFDLADFRHQAIWNDGESRIEMYLVSRREQIVRIRGYAFVFAAGERVHTENSYKYTIESFRALAAAAGWRAARCWTDGAGRFSLHDLIAA